MTANPEGGARGLLRNLSLRIKLVLLLSTVTVVALSVGFGLIVTSDIGQFRKETARAAENLAAVLAEFSVGPLGFDDPGGAQEVLARLETTEALAAAAVYDSEGVLFASWARPGVDAACPPLLDAVVEGFAAGRYDAVRTVTYRGSTWGTAVTRFSTQGLERKIRLYIGQVSLIFVVVLVLCVALAYRLQRFISGPITRLAAAADAVSAQQDLGVRVQPEGRDEIGRLCDAFNLMLSRIEARQRERDAAAGRLRESEAKYRAIVQDQTELVFRFGRDGLLLFVNEAYCRYWGLRYEELVGTSIFASVAAEDRDQVRGHMEELTAAGSVAGFAYRVVVPGGGERWHECTCRAIPGAGGSGEIQGVARDVTDLRRAEQEKQELARQLEHSHRLETIGTMAGGIAHDFNNILTPIIGCIQLARLELDDNAEAAAQLDIAGASALRAKELIQQILTFSRHADIDRVPTRVQTVVAEVLKLLAASLPRGIDVRADLDQECPPVLANGSQLHQLVVNLCTNAAQAIGDAPGVIELRLGRTVVAAAPPRADTGPAPGEYARLVIRDDGPGMTGKVRERIFEPFFTTKAPGMGTGLGLSVVHGIVAAHGGHISVESAPGAGATFTILLPLTAEAEAAAPAAAAGEAGGGGRILVVDDEPNIAGLAERMLRMLGHEVVAVTHPDAAVAAWGGAAGDFDLVITDQTMPGMAGTQLAARLGQLTPGVRVVITSGYNLAAPEYVVPASVNLVGILRKPFTLDELGAIVRQALEVPKP